MNSSSASLAMQSAVLAMVDMVYWLPIGGPVAQASWLGPKVGGQLAPFLYSSHEPSELLQWLCSYDDSTINIVVIIIIIIIIIIIRTQYYRRQLCAYPESHCHRQP